MNPSERRHFSYVNINVLLLCIKVSFSINLTTLGWFPQFASTLQSASYLQSSSGDIQTHSGPDCFCPGWQRPLDFVSISETKEKREKRELCPRGFQVVSLDSGEQAVVKDFYLALDTLWPP